MYLPPQFKGQPEAHAVPIMQAHPFASLVSVDDDGFPYVTHLPLHLESTATGQGESADGSLQLVLLGHVAKPNPHWRYLKARPKALVTFMGPHAYLSPRVYPDLARVPTWNYLAVHCSIEATLVEEPAAKERLLNKLIGDHEPPYADQWRALGEDFGGKMLAGIVGFELRVTSLQCKVKINQHRPESHAAMHAMYAAGNENEQALAVWMNRLGMKPGPVQG